MDVNSFLQKFDEAVRTGKRKALDPLLTTVMDSSNLRVEVATRFINQVVDESRLLKMIRVHRTMAPSGDIAKLNVNTNVTEKATENTDSGNSRRPVDSSISFTTVKTRSALDVSGEWGEDNIEGNGGRNTVVTAFTRAIANDMETLGIEGDTTTVGTDDYSRLVQANDGFHVLTNSTTSTHIVNAGAKRTSYKLLSEMLRNMPTKYKANISGLRWIMSWGAAQDIVDEFAARGTNYGDQMRQQGTLPPILGIPVEIIPKIPEDLLLTGTNGTTGTFIWLTVPQNLIFVVQRDFKAEWGRNARKDTDELTIHMRTDFLVEETDAVVKATNVSVWTSHGYYGA